VIVRFVDIGGIYEISKLDTFYNCRLLKTITYLLHGKKLKFVRIRIFNSTRKKVNITRHGSKTSTRSRE